MKIFLSLVGIVVGLVVAGLAAWCWGMSLFDPPKNGWGEKTGD